MCLYDNVHIDICYVYVYQHMYIWLYIYVYMYVTAQIDMHTCVHILIYPHVYWLCVDQTAACYMKLPTFSQQLGIPEQALACLIESPESQTQSNYVNGKTLYSIV